MRRTALVAFLLSCLAFGSVGFAQTRVACVGDSITAGWKLKEADRYVTKLAGLLGSDYDVQNFGHSAYCMLKIAEKSYWESPMFQAAQDFQPDIVTIMLGTNDAHPNYWPQFEVQYYQDYLDMIAVFKALPSSPTVLVLGLPYLKPGGRYDGVVALDALLPDIALDAGVEFIEIWDVLVNSGLSPNQLMKDPIHPSAAAHTIIAETIFPVVAGLGAVCGEGTCELGENPCTCPADCGLPPDSEWICADAVDEDCDGQMDCEDGDCSADPVCLIVCDNGICEPGEDCTNCALDCDSKRTGRPSGRYCCGDGVQEGPEGDGRCDGNY
jgi:sialate O-acetylesterase